MPSFSLPRCPGMKTRQGQIGLTFPLCLCLCLFVTCFQPPSTIISAPCDVLCWSAVPAVPWCAATCKDWLEKLHMSPYFVPQNICSKKWKTSMIYISRIYPRKYLQPGGAGPIWKTKKQDIFFPFGFTFQFSKALKIINKKNSWHLWLNLDQFGLIKQTRQNPNSHRKS